MTTRQGFQKSFPHLTKYTYRTGIRLDLAIASIFAISSCLLVACPETSSQTTQVSKGNRILAIQTNMGEEGDFDALFNESLEAGNEAQVFPQDWKDLEPSPGRFDSGKNLLAMANLYYSARKIPLHITIRPIHTNQKVVPPDLLETEIDDPQTIKRFKRLLDWVATQIPAIELTSLTIGSEVDIFVWGNPQRWEAWTNFYAAVAPHARKIFPNTLISCETTFAAFVGPDLAHVRTLHQHSDIIGLSYYPLNSKLEGVKPPQIVHADFQTVVNAIPQKPIIYYQIGYPSSPSLGSSLHQQAAFITEAFRAWDTHASRIRMLNFQWMHETPDVGVDQYVKYYQHDTPNFRAFLGSLGLQSWSGEPKPAWETLKKEAKTRGFGT